MKKFVQFISLALVAVMCVALLASCAPASDPDKAVAALKDAGYTALKLPALGSATAIVTGTNLDDNKKTQVVYIRYYASAEDAKTAYESLKDESDKDKKNADESDWVFAKSGKMVYWGTKDAIKAAR